MHFHELNVRGIMVNFVKYKSIAHVFAVFSPDISLLTILRVA